MSFTRTSIRWAAAALGMALALGWAGSQAAHAADLFYNYYVPGANGGPPAQLYISPRPTPPLVGHTYITYQPLMPHEMLYPHKRTYRRYDSAHRLPVNKTTVRWGGARFPGRVWYRYPTPQIDLMNVH
ncbi:MAG TPA: hypothetical protein VMV10_24910 [Pirellulales bacterium]|nr:hypothetical protein [Pirellulales bacterium]